MAKAKILIVEDEAITAKDLQDRLKELGYDAPAIAASGEEAIKKAEEIKPDLVLMDIILKGDMDGIEAAEQIRDRFDIPVVYVTAYIDEERLKKTKITEPYGYIIKPFEDKELRPAIEMALDRHKLEKALRTAEQDWRNSFNSLEDVMLIIDRDYNIENINEIGLKLLGKSKEEVIGQKCYQVISGADSPGEDCPCMKSLETKKVESTDRYEARFGKYYSIKSSPIFNENGELIKFVDLRRDITERKRAEEMLRESEERFRTIVETAPSLLIITDAEGNNIYVSPSCEVITGYTQEELRGERIWWVHEDDTPMAKELFEHTFREGVGDKNFEYKAVKKNGDLWYASSSWEPLKDEKGKFKGIVFQTIDISERKQAEERIEHLNSVLKAIRKVNQLIIIEKDRDRLLQSACDNLIETRGYYNAWIALINESGSLVTTAEAGLGKDFLPLVERLKRGELTNCGRKALMQLQVVATEDPFSTCTDCPLSDRYHDRGALTVRLEYGEKVYGLLSVSLPKELTADEEEQNLFKEVAGDLALALYLIGLEEERKRAEENLKQLTLTLQEHVEKLEESKKEITKAYSLREHFLKETSHRIITPVSIIGGYIDLLLENTNLDAEQKEKIRIIRERNEEIQKLVQDALAGKSLEEGDG